MSTSQEPNPNPVKLTPEAVVEQLRVLREQLKDDLAPLTKKQRRNLSDRGRRQPNTVVQSSISIIGAADLMEQAVGMPAAEVRRICDDSNRWTAVADELRALLNGVEGANIVRQQKLAEIAARAYTIGASLASDPSNVALVPHVEETKRLRKLARRKKPAPQNPAPQKPAPAPPTIPAPQHLAEADPETKE